VVAAVLSGVAALVAVVALMVVLLNSRRASARRLHNFGLHG
jgi:hypothetical protein